jgi:hypothetical protein
VVSVPTEDAEAETADGKRRVEGAAGAVRELIAATQQAGVRINAHMADAVASTVRDGQMSITEAVQKVTANPERYRYSRGPVSSEELERDTWAAYRKLQQQLGVVANQLRPEVAAAFGEAQRSDLLRGLDPIIRRLLQYRLALAGRPEDDEAIAGSLESGEPAARE